MATDSILTDAELSQFSGTDQWHRHFTGLLYTDGIQHLAERGGAFWLIDAIAIHQLYGVLRAAPLRRFQLWKLTRSTIDRSAVLACQADSNLPELVRQKIEFTDFPLQEIRLYVCDGTLLLPSEY